MWLSLEYREYPIASKLEVLSHSAILLTIINYVLHLLITKVFPDSVSHSNVAKLPILCTMTTIGGYSLVYVVLFLNYVQQNNEATSTVCAI